MNTIKAGQFSRLRRTVSAVALLFCLGVAGGLVAPMAGASIPDFLKIKSPKFVKPITKKPAKGTRVNVVADKITYDDRTKIATATGLVQITYGPYVLTATKVIYDTAHDIFKANASVVLREPNGNVTEADYAEVYNKFKEGFARHVKALLTNDVTITAHYARRYLNGITVYERATYTACKDCVDAGGTPLWQIVARQATHDDNEHTIYYRDMNFDIAGVPVLWLPYLAYPDPSVTRRSGFLLPQFSSGGNYGVGVTTPYFWDVAPNADLTLSPKWTTRQGPLADAEWRHHLQSGLYSVRAYGIYQLDPALASDPAPWRGAVTSKGDLKVNNVWSWGWDGTLLSDRTFLNDYGIDSKELITDNIHVTGLSDRSYLSVQAIQYQTTLADSSLNLESQNLLPTVLPYVTASHIFADPVAGGELSLEMNAYSLSRTDPVNNSHTGMFLGTDQSRVVTDLRWQKQMINGLGQVITPFMTVRSDIYDTQNVPGAPTGQQLTTDVLPSAGLDVRWPFLSPLDSGQSILTPVAQIVAAPNAPNFSSVGNEDSLAVNFDTTNIFLEDRYNGFDRYEGGTRANTGLLYSFLAENGGFVRASFGESFRIAGQNSFTAGSGLDGSASNVVGAVAFQPNDKLRFTYEARADQNLSSINSQDASVSLTLDRISSSLGYADLAPAPDYGRPDLEKQIWGDAAYKLSSAWSIFGGLRYDLRSDSFVDKSVGVQFNCDCMTASVSFTDHIGRLIGDPSERLVKLSVEFRTIGMLSGGFGL